jgi:hypothetical protein
MNGAIEAEEEGVDGQERQAVITAIRGALSGTFIDVSQNDDHAGCLFSNIDSFVKLSQGNTSVTRVFLNAYGQEGDDVLWEKMGKGLANLESLEHLILLFDEERNDDEPTPRANFGPLAIVLPYLRQEFSLSICGRAINADYSREEVKALSRIIRGHPTIKEFNTGSDFHVDTFHILLSALATLPSLEAAELGFEASQGSHFENPEALKKLMLSPSLRKVCFRNFTFSGALCRALEEALQEGSHISCLSFVYCAFLAGASGPVAKALEHNTTLTSVSLYREFPKEFYDAFGGPPH